MTAKSTTSAGFPSSHLSALLGGAAVTVALLLAPGQAAAASTESDRALTAQTTIVRGVLPGSMHDLVPLLEQHSRGGGSGGGSRGSGGGGGGGGQAVPRGGSGSSGGTQSGTPSGGSSGGSTGGSSGGGTRTRSGNDASAGSGGASGTPAQSHPRDGQPATGTAVPRRPGDIPPTHGGGGGGYYPGFYPWGWGGIGIGAYYGYYDPWGWYDPYEPAPVYSYSGYDGALKIKVKPRQAEVFVDGYFAGAVDDYDGVFQQLRLEAGPHRIEIRLDGYETLTFEVRILPDRTVTYKGEMQKQTTGN